MKYIIKKVNTIKDYERTCAHDFNSIDDLKALRDYYNEISIDVINSTDRANAQQCNLLVEILDRLDMLLNERDIYTFEKLATVLFELLYYVYKLHFCISEMLNDYNINDIFKD